MKSIIQYIKNFTSWGVLFLLLWILAFHSNITDLLHDASSGPLIYRIFPSFMLISTILYPISLILVYTTLKWEVGFLSFVSILWRPNFWIPFKGFKIQDLVSACKARYKLDTIIAIRRLICSLLFWLIVGCGIVYYLNRTIISISDQELKTHFISISLFILVIIALDLISILFYKIMEKKDLAEEYEEYTSNGTKGQNYYSGYNSHKPAACRACGGPYPDCKSSCNLFDD